MMENNDEISMEEIEKYIEYRVELALYKILLENNPDMTWEEYILIVREGEEIRKAGQCVAYDAVRLFDAKQFDFDVPEMTESDIPEKDDGQMIKVVKLFDDEDRYSLGLCLLFKVAMEYHRRLREKGIRCAESEFSQKILHDQRMIRKISYGFQMSIKKIDFEKHWKSFGMDTLDSHQLVQ